MMQYTSDNIPVYYYPADTKYPPNHTWDDEKGDYNVIVNDHLNYRYQVLQALGKGSFGKVVKAHDHKRNQTVAIKIIRNSPVIQDFATKEIKILKHLMDRPKYYDGCIVRMLTWFHFRGHLCIVFEPLGINLWLHLKHNNFHLPILTIRQYAVQLLQALQFLKEERVCHCDLKPENILLTGSQSGIKLIDFGASCFEDERMKQTYIQSRYYRAPEVVLHHSYNQAADMWSFGCIMAELYSGRPLFPGKDEFDLFNYFMNVLGSPPVRMIQRSPRKEFYNIDMTKKGADLAKLINCEDFYFISFIKSILVWEPTQRLTPAEALRHPFIVGDTSYSGLGTAPSVKQPSLSASMGGYNGLGSLPVINQSSVSSATAADSLTGTNRFTYARATLPGAARSSSKPYVLVGSGVADVRSSHGTAPYVSQSSTNAYETTNSLNYINYQSPHRGSSNGGVAKPSSVMSDFSGAGYSGGSAAFYDVPQRKQSFFMSEAQQALPQQSSAQPVMVRHPSTGAPTSINSRGNVVAYSNSIYMMPSSEQAVIYSYASPLGMDSHTGAPAPDTVMTPQASSQAPVYRYVVANGSKSPLVYTSANQYTPSAAGIKGYNRTVATLRTPAPRYQPYP